MKYYHIPTYDNGQQTEFGVNPDGEKQSIIPGNIGCFLNGKAFYTGGALAPVNGLAKPWRDNAFFWLPDLQTRTYVFPDRDAVGAVKRISTMPNSGSQIVNNPENHSGSGTPDPVLSKTLSPGALKFISEYGGDLVAIPGLKFVTLDRAEATRLSFPAPTSTPVDYPLGFVREDGSVEFYEGAVLSFSPNGELQWFRFEDYVRENPKPRSLGSGAPVMSNSELTGAARSILATSMSEDQKGAAIRQAAK